MGIRKDQRRIQAGARWLGRWHTDRALLGTTVQTGGSRVDPSARTPNHHILSCFPTHNGGAASYKFIFSKDSDTESSPGPLQSLDSFRVRQKGCLPFPPPVVPHPSRFTGILLYTSLSLRERERERDLLGTMVHNGGLGRRQQHGLRITTHFPSGWDSESDFQMIT